MVIIRKGCCDECCPCICGVCTCKTNIPNGMYSLEQVWGVDQGVMEPGVRWCWPFWKRVAVMITKNSIRFRCPVRNVPTKDNVRIQVDVGINFHIGSYQDANASGEVL